MSEQQNADVQEFNRRATTYENSTRQRFFFNRVQKAVLSLVAADAKPQAILDVGCGTGRLLRELRARWPNAKLVGVDPAEGMIAQAKQRLPEAEFYVSMAESLPLPEASVDFVFSTLSFHHWADPAKGVREVARVLRLGGCFFLADMWLPLGLSRVVGHFQRSNPAKIKKLFVDAGLVVEEQRRFRWLWLTATVGKTH
jgi:ubiquinone/menaquinone biosynthesis C-methylase UbiE